ncbi:MAG: glycoside hydrolase family 36 protein [bacterium]
MTSAALRAELPLPVVQIDAGWSRAMGDWLEPGARFPGGIEPVAARIKALGLTPGIWVAPFAVESTSRLAAEHPDWMVKDDAGTPLAWDVEWAQPKVSWHGLDGTHPEARRRLIETFAALRKMGFTYFKLDFLFMGCLRGIRAAPGTRAEAYRAGLRAIREGAGADAYLLGCTAPYPQSVGLVNGIRTSHDVFTGGDSIKHFGTVSAETHHRFWAHRVLWNADPDVMLARDVAGASPGTPRAVCLSAALSGGALFSGDPLADLTEDRLALLREMLAVSRPAPALPLDLFEREQPRLLAQALGRGRFRLGLFNHEHVARVVPLELDRLGLARARVSILAEGKASRPVTVNRRYLPPAVPAHGALLILVERV